MVAQRTILNSATVSPKKPELDRDSILSTQLPVTPASKTKALSSRVKYIFLHDWWLMKVQAEGLAVGGVASTEMLGERVFCSTVIVKIHEINVHETKDGITVVINGFINRSRTHQNGFPLEDRTSPLYTILCPISLIGRALLHDCSIVSDEMIQLFGFPHDWEEYTARGFGEEHINGVNGFGDSNMHSQKEAAFYIDDIHGTRKQDVLPSNNGNLNYCWLPRKICNELAKWQGNLSEISELIDTMEHNNTMKTTECIPKEDNKILERSQPEENQMHNGENEICNDPRKRQGNVSEQSEPTDTIEHNNAMKTTECIHKEDITTLKRSKPEDNQVLNGENGVLDVDITTLKTSLPEDNPIHNGENGVLDVTDIRQDGSPNSGCQTVMSRNSTISCREHSISRYKTPISAMKKKRGRLPNNCKKESNGQKKLLEDVDNSFRRVTRSISKGNQKTMPLGRNEEIRVKCVRTPVRRSDTPVRRSARLCNLRK